MEESSGCSSSSIDYNPCPICLGPVIHAQEAYLGRCFHKFCYKCIVRWATYVAARQSQPHSIFKCPLCKRDNFSIVYECEGDSFQRHYVNKDPVESNFFSKAHKFRLLCYYRESGAIYEKINVQKFWKLHKYLQSNKWLNIWLKRELQALTQEEDVEVVVHHVLGLIESFRKQNDRGLSQRTSVENREGFKALIYDAVKPFLVGRSERFVNELELFLALGLNIEAYDEIYSQSLDTTLSGTVVEEGERMLKENEQVPYLYFFDVDTDTDT